MNEAQTIDVLAVQAKAVPTVVKTDSGREFLVLPNEMTSQDVTPAHATDVNLPKRISQQVVLQNADSLLEYLKRFMSADTVLLADIMANRIVGAIDYHNKDKAALVQHRATLDLPYSEEWKTWAGINGQLKPQLEFARFIEENAPDIKAPDAASLLEAVRDLQAKRSVNFVKAVRTASDNENFEFTDNTEARTKGDLELPTKFLLSLPVYFGDPDAVLLAFLRWKLDNGQLMLGIKLHRAEHVRQAAFKMIVTDAAERTGLLALYGKI